MGSSNFFLAWFSFQNSFFRSLSLSSPQSLYALFMPLSLHFLSFLSASLRLSNLFLSPILHELLTSLSLSLPQCQSTFFCSLFLSHIICSFLSSVLVTISRPSLFLLSLFLSLSPSQSPSLSVSLVQSLPVYLRCITLTFRQLFSKLTQVFICATFHPIYVGVSK